MSLIQSAKLNGHDPFMYLEEVLPSEIKYTGHDGRWTAVCNDLQVVGATRPRRTMREIYREARAGRLRSSAYTKFATLASLFLIIVGMYLLLSGD